MLYHSPSLPYSGLTVILSNPSRFDNEKLIGSGKANSFFGECLAPHFNRYQCDIRLMQEERPLLKGTKAILMMGEYALRKYNGNVTSLNEQRGNPFNGPLNIPSIVTYSPQDTQEQQDYESEYNPWVVREDTRIGAEGAQDEKRRHGKTDRKNYAFWFKKDVEKIIKIVHQDSVYINKHEFNYHIWSDASIIYNTLINGNDRDLYFDIETDANLNITCFAFCFGYPDVYVVPCLDWNYNRAYRDLARIFTGLAIAFKKNTVVAHNAMGFDLFVMAEKYKIPFRRAYDTMLAQNRIYPEIEKSLGHAISLPWMFEPYHKNESNFSYRNEQQCRQLWQYCGKDVSSLVLLKKAQDDYAKSHIGIRSSIDSVNSYIRPYLTTTLTGIRYDRSALEKNILDNDAKCNAYLKMTEILVGKANLVKLRGAGKGTLLSSPIQAVKYFHEMLNYPIVGYTETKKPSLSATYIYKLKLLLATYVEKNGGIINPILDLIIAYRQLAKETGTLKFIPYKE